MTIIADSSPLASEPDVAYILVSARLIPARSLCITNYVSWTTTGLRRSLGGRHLGEVVETHETRSGTEDVEGPPVSPRLDGDVVLRKTSEPCQLAAEDGMRGAVIGRQNGFAHQRFSRSVWPGKDAPPGARCQARECAPATAGVMDGYERPNVPCTERREFGQRGPEGDACSAWQSQGQQRVGPVETGRAAEHIGRTRRHRASRTRRIGQRPGVRSLSPLFALQEQELEECLLSTPCPVDSVSEFVSTDGVGQSGARIVHEFARGLDSFAEGHQPFGCKRFIQGRHTGTIHDESPIVRGDR